MALNPFFRQEVASEQRLVQDLVNEHLRMYGQEVYYMPRKYFGTDSIMRENVLSRFNDTYPIEAYVANVQGFQGSGDLMTKFGIRVTDESTFIISKERFEDYIADIMSNIDESEDQRRADPDDGIAIRPMEGDLVYFPLTDSLFEIKFVEHENPFYQLGKTYVYELRCELFEYEQEVIDTGIEYIDDNVKDIGYVVTLNLASQSVTATAIGQLSNGSVNEIFLENDGYGYATVPTVAISTSPNGDVLANATAVAIGTVGAGQTTYSVQSVKIVNPGFGYTTPPTVTFVSTSGSGAKARAGIATVGSVYASLTSGSGLVGGRGYIVTPNVAITTSPVGVATANATAVAVVGTSGSITDIRFTNAGFGYTTAPSISIDNPDQTRRATALVGFSTAGLGTVTSISITDPGIGYTVAPSLTFSNPSGFRAGIITAGVGVGSTVNSLSIDFAGVAYLTAPTLTITGPSSIGAGIGTTATATAFINATTGIITGVTITNPGLGYTEAPTVSLSGGIGTAAATALINSVGVVTSVNITNVGAGYTTKLTVTFSSPALGINTGDYIYNEIVTGQAGLATALVKEWDASTKVLKIYSVAGDFRLGETIVGSATTVGAADTSHVTGKYSLKSISYEHNDSTGVDAFESNTEIQDAATDVDGIVDWTETNPFGTF